MDCTAHFNKKQKSQKHKTLTIKKIDPKQQNPLYNRIIFFVDLYK